MKKAFKVLSGLTLSLMAGSVFAAVPLGIDTAVTTAQTDASTVAGYVIVALAGLVALKWMTSLVRRA